MAHTVPDIVDCDLAVVGGGIVGLAIAWEAQRLGRSVTVIDPAPATGATFAAAGMLAPVSELHYQEESLLELTLASAARWPEFVAPLVAAGHTETGFRATPTLVLGADAADRAALAELREVQLAHGLGVEQFSIRDARAAEPLVGPHISCAFMIAADHQVDPRGVADAILSQLSVVAAQRGRVADEQTFIRASAVALLHAEAGDTHSRVSGVVLDDGREVNAREVVVANGLGAPALEGLPDGLNLPVRAVYGDILRLLVPEHLRPLTTATIRGLVRGVPVYIVPRNDNTVVLGATMREDGMAAVNAGGVYRILRDAQTLVPAVAELELIETTARARPGTPDNAPLLGRVADSEGRDIPGLIVATGFFRHGVLLSAIAAHITRQLLDGITDLAWESFRPDRFSPALQAAQKLHVPETLQSPEDLQTPQERA
ncbi:glycine oxidase ThiO [Arthrobacter cryoconiti]|uniref:glycine oxidase n=1 Tax=Arthrobacter cryoconiti TaxID=748907 RepID=A0ABV8R1U4_9MICC|nr:glycine oxidase ThiO [Arthrobacter cryoconiti]MCC9068330.1 glycine oxidase ThiO [Arthrobacter cryoconiti]